MEFVLIEYHRLDGDEVNREFLAKHGIIHDDGAIMPTMKVFQLFNMSVSPPLVIFPMNCGCTFL